MTAFHALVDAMTGREDDVERALRAEPRIAKLVRVKQANYDMLIEFDAPAFDKVDEFLQTHVRRVPGVAGVEVVVDWADHGEAVRAARAKLR